MATIAEIKGRSHGDSIRIPITSALASKKAFVLVVDEQRITVDPVSITLTRQGSEASIERALLEPLGLRSERKKVVLQHDISTNPSKKSRLDKQESSDAQVMHDLHGRIYISPEMTPGDTDIYLTVYPFGAAKYTTIDRYPIMSHIFLDIPLDFTLVSLDYLREFDWENMVKDPASLDYRDACVAAYVGPLVFLQLLWNACKKERLKQTLEVFHGKKTLFLVPLRMFIKDLMGTMISDIRDGSLCLFAAIIQRLVPGAQRVAQIPFAFNSTETWFNLGWVGDLPGCMLPLVEQMRCVIYKGEVYTYTIQLLWLFFAHLQPHFEKQIAESLWESEKAKRLFFSAADEELDPLIDLITADNWFDWRQLKVSVDLRYLGGYGVSLEGLMCSSDYLFNRIGLAIDQLLARFRPGGTPWKKGTVKVTKDSVLLPTTNVRFCPHRACRAQHYLHHDYHMYFLAFKHVIGSPTAVKCMSSCIGKHKNLKWIFTVIVPPDPLTGEFIFEDAFIE